jgi:hypothetical protein
MTIASCCQLCLWLVTWVILQVCNSGARSDAAGRTNRHHQQQGSERSSGDDETYDDNADEDPELGIPIGRYTTLIERNSNVTATLLLDD